MIHCLVKIGYLYIHAYEYINDSCCGRVRLVLYLLKIFLFKRGREEYKQEGQKETESQADAALNVEPDTGLDLTTVR